MYRNCIFCSAPLGSNESLERFPVGRSVAFDGEKGRLWAVCPRCARWNLAPIEERWEAIEDAERLFRDSRLRVQRENIGLARLRDGTRLVRVGEALPGELAAWRYGQTLVRRRVRYVVAGGAVVTLGAAAGLVAGTVGAGVSIIAGYHTFRGVLALWEGWRNRAVVQQLWPRPAAEGGRRLVIRRRDLAGSHLVQPGEGGLGVHFPGLREKWDERVTLEGGSAYTRERSAPLTVTGERARTLLARAMVHVNDRGARADRAAAAVRRIAAAGSPDAFLLNAASARRLLLSPEGEAGEPMGNLALEMALHEETERRALEGELAMLQAMWKEAEEIAAIADRLPDLPADDAPRVADGD